MKFDIDVLVIGAGFGGSLMALVLKQIGLSPLLVERGRHPRFALGESSTPVADLVLSEIAARYDLKRIAPLSRYGTWCAAYPEINRGLKRGFSFFQHRPGQAFQPRGDHANCLLVAASSRDETADTHWHRGDVDHFFVREAQAAGIPYLDRTEITAVEGGPAWRVEARQGDEPVSVRAKLIVDASGDGGVLARAFGISTEPAGLFTHSRVVYGHFAGVRPWHEVAAAAGARVADYPFPAHQAALHHVLDGGWMYVLPFDDGVTSAGFALDLRRHPAPDGVSPADEWHEVLARYPSIAEQFAAARPVAPAGGIRRSGRLQRLAARAAGPGWAMLPSTAGIIDPLHSSGNAHNLCGIQRLAGIVERSWDRPELAGELEQYHRTVLAEVRLIDRLVHGCYLTFAHFELMAAFAMWYFVAAIWSEHRRRAGVAAGDAFLSAQDPELYGTIVAFHERLTALVAGGEPAAADVERYLADTRQSMAPYNLEGLCDPQKHSLYTCPDRCGP